MNLCSLQWKLWRWIERFFFSHFSATGAVTCIYSSFYVHIFNLKYWPYFFPWGFTCRPWSTTSVRCFSMAPVGWQPVTAAPLCVVLFCFCLLSSANFIFVPFLMFGENVDLVRSLWSLCLCGDFWCLCREADVSMDTALYPTAIILLSAISPAKHRPGRRPEIH